MTTIISETQTFSLISPPCGGDLHNETDIYETDLMNPTYINSHTNSSSFGTYTPIQINLTALIESGNAQTCQT